MVEHEPKTACGIYRDRAGWATVSDGTITMSMPRERYEEKGYEPPFEALPVKGS